MPIRSWFISTRSRPSCRRVRCSSSKEPRRRRRLDASPSYLPPGSCDLESTGPAMTDKPTPENDRPMVDGDGLRHHDRALVLHPTFKTGPRAVYSGGRSPETRLEEAAGLARAIDLNIAAAEVIRISEPKPATLIGSGGVARLAAL